MVFPAKPGVCDCHSHVLGPFTRFPLSPKRAYDPPEAPIEQLEKVWESLGMDRAVLVQASAYGNDHGALLEALSQSPETRRGVALLNPAVDDGTLRELHQGGVRAVRLNRVKHLLGNDSRSEQQYLAEAAELLERLFPLGWHVEIHIDIDDLDFVTRIRPPRGMPVVIDHMARMDLSAPDASDQLTRFLRVLEDESFWVKLSGADRLAVKCEDLNNAADPMRQILKAAPERCVWGLDWPHVRLPRKRSDCELADLLLNAAGDEKTLERVLVQNPAKLYGFSLATT